MVHLQSKVSQSLENSGEPLGEENVTDISASRRNHQDEQQFDASVGGQAGLGCDSGISAGTDRKADAVEKSGDALEEYLEEDEADKHAGAEGGIGELGAAGGPLHCVS